VRGRFALLPIRFVLACVRVLPASLFPLLATVTYWLALPFAQRDLRQLQRNVQRIYGLPPGTHFARLFERQVLRHHVICILETLRLIQEPKRIQVAGIEDLQANVRQAEAGGKGHIVVTAHIGSWELCAYFGRLVASRPFSVLAKPMRYVAATDFLGRLRARMGVQVLWTDRKSLLRDMLTALKAGESVGFVMDQKPDGRKGPVVDFLGQPTEFVSGPATMAIKTGCAVVSIFCLREGLFRYRLHSRLLLKAGHGETDELVLTQRLATEIAAIVRAYPEQWTWNYKRWREASASRDGASAAAGTNSQAVS